MVLQIKTFMRKTRSDTWGKFWELTETLEDYEKRVNDFLASHKIVNIQTLIHFGRFKHVVTYETN